MYSTTAYLYQQKQQVILIDTSGAYFDRRWQPVYAKNLKIHRGVDNVILFEFVNQDQKPVNISGSTFTFRLISTNGDVLLLSKDLVVLNSQFGRAKVTLLSTELDNIDAQPAGWSIERSAGNLNEAVFTDAYSGGRGMCDIVDSVYPDFVPSEILTVPSNPERHINNPNRNYTSMAYVEGRELVTFQFEFDNFSGNVKAQGSKTQLGPWYDIDEQRQYINQEDRVYWNVEGFHDYLRFEVNQYGIHANVGNALISGGEVTTLTVGNGGNEYISTNNPNVEFNGLGTGATAYAVVANASVVNLVLTSGGEGYVNTPNVKINNGYITNITYR